MQNLPNPHVRTRVRLLNTSEGGRRGPTPEGMAFGCLIVIEEQNYDCRMVPVGAASFKPGAEAEALIQFVSPELIVASLHVGKKFHVRDGRIVGEGEVLEVLPGAR